MFRKRPAVVCYYEKDCVHFYSVPSRQEVLTLRPEHKFTTAVFNNKTYLLQDTGLLEIYDHATLRLEESVQTEGLERLADIFVTASRLICVETRSYCILADHHWYKMKGRPEEVFTARSCVLGKQVYVTTSTLHHGPSWCMNCACGEGDYWASDLYLMDETSQYLKRIDVELTHSRYTPELLPEDDTHLIVVGGNWIGKPQQHVYRFNTKTNSLHSIGSIPNQGLVTSACIVDNRLYALYTDKGFLNVSLITGIGQYSDPDVVFSKRKLIWCLRKAFQKLPLVLVQLISTEYLKGERKYYG